MRAGGTAGSFDHAARDRMNPPRLGSIWAAGARRPSAGTGLTDPDGTACPHRPGCRLKVLGRWDLTRTEAQPGPFTRYG